ncbi:MAG: aldehyde ferredoxin oxidoreductase N-terminal domain-containing protein, partial [Dehalococcoidales bacterium]
MDGHAGKILKLDLSAGRPEIIPTSRYEEWIGGIGIGTALFWDEVDKDYITDTSRISGFEPENVVCIVPGVMSGAMAPGGARTEVCGVAPEVYPRPQFIRSNFGGNFAPMLKFAGYDAIVVTGRAAAPVWVDIRDERVTFRDAGDLWGLGFYDAEKRIWSEVSGSEDYRQQGWHEGTTQRAAVVGIGQCGENLSRIGCLVHGADTAAGCGGFGGVFGSKNLKAISVIGTGSLVVARPEELMAVWQWVAKHRPKKLGATFPEPLTDQRRISCFGCMSACKVNTKRKEMSGSVGQCIERGFYVAEDRARHGKNTRAEHVAGQLAQDYGINLYAAWDMLVWLESLHGRGLLGKGRAIDTDLDFDSLGSEEFIRDYLGRIAHGTEIGADLAEGWVRAAAKWGILEEELASGAVSAIHWGIGDQHWTNNVEWAYLSLFDARDCNAHDIQFGETLEKTAERYAELAPPWHDKLMLDQSRTGVYSIHCAR